MSVPRLSNELTRQGWNGLRSDHHMWHLHISVLKTESTGTMFPTEPESPRISVITSQPSFAGEVVKDSTAQLVQALDFWDKKSRLNRLYDSGDTIPQLEQRKTSFSLSLEIYEAVSRCTTLKPPNTFSHTSGAESKSIIKDICKHKKSVRGEGC